MGTKSIFAGFVVCGMFFLISCEDGGGGGSWVVRIGGENHDSGRCAVVLRDGTVAVAGTFVRQVTFNQGRDDETTISSTAGDIFVAGYRSDGSLAWVTHSDEGRGGVKSTSLSALAGGSFLMAGSFSGGLVLGAGETNETSLYPESGDDMFLARYDANGLLEWARRDGGSSVQEVIRDIAALDDGSFLVTGYFGDDELVDQFTTFGSGQENEVTVASAGSLDAFVARYGPDGDFERVLHLGGGEGHGDGGDFGNSLSVGSDGSFAVAGRIASDVTFGSGEPNQITLLPHMGCIFLASYDDGGTLSWAVNAGIGACTWVVPDEATDSAILSDGSIVVVGHHTGGSRFGYGEPNETWLESAGWGDIFIARYNADGTLAWVRRAGGSETDYLARVAVLPDDNMLVVGAFSQTATFGPGEAGKTLLTSAGGQDVFIAKYRPDGSLVWVLRSGGEGDDTPGDLSIAPDGACYLSGTFTGSATFDLGHGRTIDLASPVDERDREVFLMRLTPEVVGALDQSYVQGE